MKLDKTLMLQAEIAALLHDLGKFSGAFLEKTLQGGSPKALHHSKDFLSPRGIKEKMITPGLQNLLNKEVGNKWFSFPDQAVPLRTLGDLLKFHHTNNLEEILKYYHGEDSSDKPIPLALKLLMMADTIDSASSKGGAAFKDKERESRLTTKKVQQKKDSCYLATPFGEQGKKIDIEQIEKEAEHFQHRLTDILDGFEDWNPQQLVQKREELLSCMKEKLSSVLAETRIPNNDVTLWQHSHSTASIFKAMLAWHLLTEDYDENNQDLVYHTNKLAFLGVKWDEHRLIKRAVRPKEILGIKEALFNLQEEIRKKVETEFCLGNEMYRDGNSIYFLVPSPNEEELKKKEVQDVHLLLHAIQECIDGHALFKGGVSYRIVAKDVGIQPLGLSRLLDDDDEDDESVLLQTGPEEPAWIELWEENFGEKEICSRCGLKPVDKTVVTSGNEADMGKICSFCAKLIKNGENVRTRLEKNCPLTKKLLGLEPGAQYQNFKTDELIEEGDENRRLALVQGFFDFRPFMGGNAYTSIFTHRPEQYNKNPGKKDKSRDIQDWHSLVQIIQEIWTGIKEKTHVSTEELHTLQQLFQDTYLGTDRDGRVKGEAGGEKIRNYINDIVLASPFPHDFPEELKIALYALRQHPAPSRLARVWEQSHRICSESIRWCENNKVHYFPVTLEPEKFMVLLPAEKAWDLMQEMYRQYQKQVGRIRHLLPFHLAASVFYYKAPLYIAIDAMNRFYDVHRSTDGKPVSWTLEETPHKTGEPPFYRIAWKDRKRRLVEWNVPALLPDGREDTFYSWFWISNGDRPYHISELEKGQEVWIYPSTFDFEVLDTTGRRYDIRIDEDKKDSGRPHIFCGKNGPRPYPLADIEKWQAFMEHPVYKKASPAQLNRLISMVGHLHQEWKNHDSVARAQADDYLTLCLGKEGRIFSDMAASGALFDLYEWKHFIGISEDKNKDMQTS